MKKKEILLLVAVAAVAGLVGIGLGWKKWQVAEPAASVAHQFYAQSLPDINDKKTTMSQWQGKLLLVNFWATWCAPCVEEMPDLVELQAELQAKNVQVIGIGIDSADNIREFAGKYKIDYPLYIAGMEGIDLSRNMGNQHGGLPFTILLGMDGEVKKRYLGRLDMQEVRRDLAQFL